MDNDLVVGADSATSSTNNHTTIIVPIDSVPHHQHHHQRTESVTETIIGQEQHATNVIPRQEPRLQPTHPSFFRTNDNFLSEMYSELTYWLKAIAVGHRDNPHSNNEHFIRSIPYLSEYPHHDTIPKQMPTSKTNFHHLFDDVLHLIMGYLDCKSILNVSRVSVCLKIVII